MLIHRFPVDLQKHILQSGHPNEIILWSVWMVNMISIIIGYEVAAGPFTE